MSGLLPFIFFQTNHGQNEGDLMHSVIERKIKKMGELFLPPELAIVMKVARKLMLCIKWRKCLLGNGLDWKARSVSVGFLRCRQNDDGNDINWKEFMSIKFKKGSPQKFYIKTSNLEEEFSEVSLQQERRHRMQQIPDALPNPVYECPSLPKLSEDKYKDLMELTKEKLQSSSMQIMCSFTKHYHIN